MRRPFPPTPLQSTRADAPAPRWALARPAAFLWFEPLVTPALALTMGLMGTTLTAADFRGMAAAPGRVALG